MHTGDIVIQARLHTSGLWITVPIMVGAQRHHLAMVFDSGSPISAISPEVRDGLAVQGLLGHTARAGAYRLAPVVADQQDLPDLEVRVLPRLARIQVHGLIGLNYMRHFESIHVHIPTLTITLQFPMATG